MEGLRTLVITQKILNEDRYAEFSNQLKAASTILDSSREERIQEVIASLESNMDFLAVTGVEDKL